MQTAVLACEGSVLSCLSDCLWFPFVNTARLATGYDGEQAVRTGAFERKQDRNTWLCQLCPKLQNEMAEA